jgi:hypothetical protein
MTLCTVTIVYEIWEHMRQAQAYGIDYFNICCVGRKVRLLPWRPSWDRAGRAPC